MTLPCTFGSTAVPTRLVRSLKIIGSYEYEVEVECATKTFSDYTTLAAMAAPCGVTRLLSGKVKVTTLGTSGTLVLNGTTKTNCYIKDISAAEADGSQLGLWLFSITFVQDTST